MHGVGLRGSQRHDADKDILCIGARREQAMQALVGWGNKGHTGARLRAHEHRDTRWAGSLVHGAEK